MGLQKYLQQHTAARRTSFHVPGHKGSALYRRFGYDAFLDHLVDWDITEIAGSDNLHQPEGVIAETMARYRALYGTKETFLLVNGSSAGLMAAVMTVCRPGDTILVARNCHKSVFNGIYLAGAKPAYVYPEILKDYGITGEITVESVRKALHENPEAVALLITSPNYYGISSDIQAIADLVHQAGKVLVVDQAHGAHLKFFDDWEREHVDVPRLQSAESLGADLIINSTHKTLATFTQSSVINLCSDRVDREVLHANILRLESTSPSYLLMASQDVNADLMEHHGRELIQEWKENLARFYQIAGGISGLRILMHPRLDDSKINLDFRQKGLSGPELEDALWNRGIDVELSDEAIVMCMSGIGNTWADYEKLIRALQEIGETHPSCSEVAEGNNLLFQEESWSLATLKNSPLTQREIPGRKHKVPLGDGVGKTSAAMLVPYPPGVPVVCPGEVLDQPVVDYLLALRESGKSVLGIDEDGCILVGAEEA